uniref:Uncharacterized protein n=1 Tax=Fagus sylvatica TaxID=28930 RepID=A0A2N9GN00_FAGSY
MLGASSNNRLSSPSRNDVIPTPNEPGRKIEMYFLAFYAACTTGGIHEAGSSPAITTSSATRRVLLQQSRRQRSGDSDPAFPNGPHWRPSPNVLVEKRDGKMGERERGRGERLAEK